MHTNVSERTRAYIQENFLYMRPDVTLASEDSLLGRGIIDSMGIMELVAFLESEFGIAVVEDEITEANLGSIQAIGEYVTAKTTASRAA